MEQKKQEQGYIQVIIYWEKGMELGNLVGQKENSSRESGNLGRKMAMESGNPRKETSMKASGKTTGKTAKGPISIQEVQNIQVTSKTF